MTRNTRGGCDAYGDMSSQDTTRRPTSPATCAPAGRATCLGLGAVIAGLALLSTPSLDAARIDTYIESVRSNAKVIYVARVEHVETETVNSWLKGRARLRILKVFRDLVGHPPQTVEVHYTSYDDHHPPPDGGPTHQLAPGDHVLVFSGRFDEPLQATGRSLLYEPRYESLLDAVTRLRQQLVDMSPEQMEFHRITEADRPRQLELYDQLLPFLKQLARSESDEPASQNH